jgi:hypothetical protein
MSSRITTTITAKAIPPTSKIGNGAVSAFKVRMFLASAGLVRAALLS